MNENELGFYVGRCCLYREGKGAAGLVVSTGTENLSRQAKPRVWPESPDSSVKLSFLDIKHQLTRPLIQTAILMNECAKADPKAV